MLRTGILDDGGDQGIELCVMYQGWFIADHPETYFGICPVVKLQEPDHQAEGVRMSII